MHTDTWGQLDQHLAALEVRQAVSPVVEDARSQLTYDAVFFGGSGPPKSFWERKHKAALTAGRLSLHERATLEATEISGFPTQQEWEELEQREFPFLKKLLVETYNAYRTAWTTQGNQESPQFLNDLWHEVFKPLARALLEDGQVNLPELSGVAHIAALLKRLPLRRRSNIAVFVVKDLRERIRLDARRLHYSQAEKVTAKSPRDGSRKRSKRYSTPYEGLKRKEDSHIDWIIHKAGLTDNEKEVAELKLKYTKPDGSYLTYAEIGRRLNRNRGLVHKQYRQADMKLKDVGGRFSSQTKHFTGRNVVEENLIREIDEKNRPNTH